MIREELYFYPDEVIVGKPKPAKSRTPKLQDAKEKAKCKQAVEEDSDWVVLTENDIKTSDEWVFVV